MAAEFHCFFSIFAVEYTLKAEPLRAGLLPQSGACQSFHDIGHAPGSLLTELLPGGKENEV